MKIEEEIMIIAQKFGISESEIKKVIGHKEKNKQIKKRGISAKKNNNDLFPEKVFYENNPIDKDSNFFVFTEDGYNKLLEKIKKIQDEISELGKMVGESCDDSETFHDNFDYEEGNRQQHMWSKELKKFLAIKNRSRIVSNEGVSTKVVSIGKKVTIENLVSKDKRTFKIGSYLSFSHTEISYVSPIAIIIMGAKQGEIRKGRINNKEEILKIIKIE